MEGCLSRVALIGRRVQARGLGMVAWAVPGALRGLSGSFV
jgi:hypothetical protein